MFATIRLALSQAKRLVACPAGSINELRIWWHLRQFRNDFKPIEFRNAHWKRARDLIRSRSPKMVALMEQERGLV